MTARHANRHAPQYPGLEDTATCLFELENGGSAVMSFDYLRPPGAPTHGDERLRLMGSHGALEIRTPDFAEFITADAFRISEVALKTREAADTRTRVSLT